jgi:hypothetical protein
MKLKKPINKYYFGKIVHGCPYFMPMNFNRNIISIRKNSIPMVRRSKEWLFNLFGNQYWIQIGWPIKITWHGLGWKDKYDTPRFEFAPGFYIFFFHWQLCIWEVSPISRTDKYYEQKLWLEKYSNNNYNKAKETWPWVDGQTKESTWDDKFFEI